MTTVPRGIVWIAFALWIGTPSPSQAFGDMEVSAIVRHNPDLARYDHPGGVWMGRDRSYDIDGAGNISGSEHLIARVVDADWGKETFSPMEIDFWGESRSIHVKHARVWTSAKEFVDLPNDRVSYVDSPLSKGIEAYAGMRRLVIDFDDVKPGDVVELILSSNDRITGGEYNIRWFSHLYGDNIATVEERLSIRHPRALRPYVGTLGSPVRGHKAKDNGYLKTSWTTGHLKAFDAEIEQSLFSRRSLQSSVPDSASQLIFCTSDWNYLSSYLGRYWNHLADEISSEFRREVGSISSNLRGEKRIRTIEKWVQDEIETLAIHHRQQGLRPQPPTTTYPEKAASEVDKALLMVAALRIAGVHGSPVLVRTRTEAWLPELGCPDQLDRFLVRVQTSGKTYWLDPIDSTTPIPETVGWLIAFPELDTDFGMIDVPAR